jgi:hypothetical protein
MTLKKLALLMLIFAYGCSGGAAGGCAGLTPLPGGARYSGPKSDNAVNVRLSANGLNYLNSNWQTLIGAFAPGNVLKLPVPCSIAASPVGDFAISDTNQDGACTATDVPHEVEIKITGFSLQPKPTDSLDAVLQISVDTKNIPMASVSDRYGGCLGLARLKCAVRYNAAEVLPNDNRMKATVKFSISTKWDKLLAFDVASFQGTEVCGSSGAGAPPECLQPADILFDGQGTCGNVLCGAADLQIVKSTVLRLISPLLQRQIKAAIGTQTCESCGTAGMRSCPTSTDGTMAQSVCTTNVCQDVAASKCVPRFLGTEGRAGLGALLGNFGVSPDAEIDLSLAAGSSVSADQGLTFGTRAGVSPVKIADCVVPASAPPLTALGPPNFDAEATPGSGYHVGLGISANFLNATFHAVHQSGGFCFQLSTQNVGLINTGLFKTFLPSLGQLAGRDGKDAPMMVVLRPARPPNVIVGKGTYDPISKKPIKPLITLALPELSIDFYAMIDDRFVRLFTLTADISLPLSLIFEGCDKVTPALGDVRMLIQNIRTSNSEMLAEDPQVLADLVPAVIGLAEPALASALKGFALPALGSFKLKVNETKGLSNISGSESYNHLGLYATLLPANAACATVAPRLSASFNSIQVPLAKDLRLQGKPLPWTKVLLNVGTAGIAGIAEYSFKIDDGLFTDFVPAPNGILEVTHGSLLLQGRHVVSVRARMQQDPQGISSAIEIPVTVDFDAPDIKLVANRASDRLEVLAHDVVSGGTLEYAYRVGNEPQTPFGAPRDISLSAIEKSGGVTVFVRDEAQFVSEASFGLQHAATPTPNIKPRIEFSDAHQATDDDEGGCASVSFAPMLALLALVNRRKRQANA